MWKRLKDVAARRVLPVLRAPETAALTLVLAAAGLYAGLYLTLAIGPLGTDYTYELAWYAPSAMFALGHGMVTPHEPDIPALSEFLLMKRDSLPPEAIPGYFGRWDLSPFNRTHHYSMLAVGWVWRIFGVSWHSIKVLPWLLFVAAAGFLYGLFRFGMGRIPSALGALLVMAAPPMTTMMTSIRDFSKAPFILGGMFCIAWLALRPMKPWRALAFAAFTGLLLGVGIGFRQDTLIAVPPALVAALCARLQAGRRAWLWRPVLPAVLLAAFLFAGRPVLDALGRDQGAVSSHSLFQGLSKEAQDNLELWGGDYEISPDGTDNLIHSIINSYARRTGDDAPMDLYLSPAYGAAGRRMFREVAGTLPGDILTRACAAVLATARIGDELPRRMAYVKQGENGWVRLLARIHGPAAEHFARFGMVYVLAAAAAIATRSLWAGLVAAGLLMWFGGYVSVLFHYRHAFHLAFVPWWAALFLLSAAAQKAWAAVRARGLDRRAATLGALRGAGTVAALLALCALGLAAARAWQDRTMAAVAASYRGAPLEKLACTDFAEGGRHCVRLTERPKNLADSASKKEFESSWEFLMLELGGEGTAGLDHPVEVSVDYQQGVGGNDFTRKFEVRPGGGKPGPVRFFFPVYEISALPPVTGGYTSYIGPAPWVRGKFLGVSVPEKDAALVTGLHRVAGAESFPLLFFMTCPEGGPSTHKRMALERWLAGGGGP